MSRYVKIREVCTRLHIEDSLVRELAAEGLVEIRTAVVDQEDGVSTEDAEKMRVIAVLMREMDVNVAGVEVILHMREEVLAMRRQFDEVVTTLVQELRKQVNRD